MTLPQIVPPKNEIVEFITELAREIATEGMSSYGNIPFVSDPKSLRRAHPRRAYEEDKARLKNLGIDAFIAREIKIRENFKGLFPQFIELEKAVMCDPSAPDDLEGVLRKYYTDEFPKQTYDEYIAAKAQQYSLIPIDKLKELIEETLYKMTERQILIALASFLGDVPPKEIASLIHEGAGLTSETADYLSNTNDDVTRLPDNLAMRIESYQGELSMVAKALGKALTAAKFPIVVRFDEIVEATRENKKAYVSALAAQPDEPKKRPEKRLDAFLENV